MTEKHEDLDDVVTDEIVEQTLEEMDDKAPAAPKADPDATSPEDAVKSVDDVVKDAPAPIKKVHPKTKAGMISEHINASTLVKEFLLDIQHQIPSFKKNLVYSKTNLGTDIRYSGNITSNTVR